MDPFAVLTGSITSALAAPGVSPWGPLWGTLGFSADSGPNVHPEVGFLSALLLTVALLVGAAISGRRRQIRVHVTFVLCAVASLAVAIVFALRVGEYYDLEAAGRITPIHLGLARFTTAMYLWPLVTGPLAARKKIPRRIHHVGAWLALLLTLAATITGVMMLMGAERYDSLPERAPEFGVEQER